MANNDIHFMRKELDKLQTKMIDFSVITEYAKSYSDTVAPTSGWNTEKPAGEEGYFIWVRNIMNLGYGDVISEPYCIGDGLEHITGLDVEYISWSDPYQAPPHDANGWQTTAPSVTYGNYIWTRTKIITTEQITYTDPVRITGDASEEIAIGNGYPSGSYYVHVVYADVNNPTSWNQCFRYPANHGYVGVLVNDDAGYVTTPSSYSWSAYNPTKGVSVGNGKYFHIKYSNNKNGIDANNNVDMNDKGGLFIGYCTDTNVDDPNTPASYTWVRLEGKGILEIIEYYNESTNYSVAPVNGWTTAPPSFRAGYFYWTKSIIYYTDNTTYETTPICVSGVDGTGVHYVYYCKDTLSAPPTPTWSTIYGNVGTSADYNRWVEDPVAVDESTPYLYISSSTDYNAVTGEWRNFSTPSLWAKYGADGQDGEGFEIVFYRSETPITWSNSANNVRNPHALSSSVVSSTAFQTADYIPFKNTDYEWSDDAKGVDSTNIYEYACTRTKNKDGVWSAFGNPFLWSKYGNDGQDGAGFEIVFYQSPTAINWDNHDENDYRNPATIPTNATNFQTPDYIPWKTDSNASKRWSDDAQGVSSSSAYEYASTRTSSNGTWSAFGKPFLWANYGNDGQGFQFIYFTTTIDNPSNLPAVGTISQTPVAEKWCELPYGVTNAKQYCYIRVKEYVNESWGSWSSPVLWAKFGATGQQGGQGERGEDGQGLEMIFKTTTTKTAPTFSNNENLASFTGTVNGKTFDKDDFVPTGWSDDPNGVTNTNLYEWVSMRLKTVPANGKQASWGNFTSPSLWSTYTASIKSVTNYYLATSYSSGVTTANGNWGTWSTSIQATDSSKPYLWNYEVVKDSDGKTIATTSPCIIANSSKSIKTVTEYYCISKSTTAPADSSFGTSVVSTTPQNPYLWNYEVLTFFDNTTSKSNKRIISTHGAKGDQGIQGKHGEGYEIVFYISADPITWNSSNDYRNPSTISTSASGYQTAGYVPWKSDSNTAKRWTSNPTGVSLSKQYEYGCKRTINEDGVWSAFGTPFLFSKLGEDGIGTEYIYYRSASEITNWASDTTLKNPAKWTSASYNDNGTTKLVADDDFFLASQGWTDNPSGVNSSYPFEYVSQRNKIINSTGLGNWGTFTVPTLWAKFGDNGKDGITPDTPELVNKVTNAIEKGEVNVPNVDALTLGGNGADAFMTAYPTLEPIEQSGVGSGRVECRMLGSLIIINVIGCTVYNTGASMSDWEPIKQNSTTNISVPTAYRPSSRLITGAGSTGGHSRANQVALSSNGEISMKRQGFWNTDTGTSETVDATFVFFKDNRTTTTLSWNSSTTLYTGDQLIVTLKAGSTALSGKQITITMDGVNYSRKTDSNGQAKLNLNLSSGDSGSTTSKVHYFSVRFSGDKTYKPATIGSTNLTLNKSTGNNVKLTCTNTQTSNGILIGKSTPVTGSLKNTNNNPIRNVTVKLSVAGMNKVFTALTDADGNFKIYHPNDGLNYAVSLGRTTQLIIDANMYCGAKTITVSGVTYGGA